MSKDTTAVSRPRSGRIDVQFHFSPDFYTRLVKEDGRHEATDRWSVANALAYMDANGVAAGILSVSTPGVDLLDRAGSVALARRLNEAAAEVVAAHPDRFGSFATLPMQDVDAALVEIDHCFDVLKVDGVCLMSNVKGAYPGDPRFAPVLDALDRRGAAVFVHPTNPEYGRVAAPQVGEWPFDTCRAAVDLVYSGATRRRPDLKIILAHAGGALPAVHRRVVEMAGRYAAAEPPVLMSEAIDQIAGYYYDLAISAHSNVIGALRAITSLDHVLFACDWPFAPDHAVRMNIAGLEALDLTPAERHSIDRGAAELLFPRLAAAHASGTPR